MQGRFIIENVLLTQEIIMNIRKRGKPANVIINIDMTKTYDRVSWQYLIKFLVKHGLLKTFYGHNMEVDC